MARRQRGEFCMVEIGADAPPCLEPDRLRRHHRIDAEQRNAAQDERRDAGGQVHALPASPQAATAPP